MKKGEDHSRQPLTMAPSSKYSTPKRGGKGKNKKQQQQQQQQLTSSRGKAKAKVKAVDLVTGKTTVEYFFDPSLVLDKPNSSNGIDTPFKTPAKERSEGAEDPRFFASKHLFVPCTIIKPLDEENSKGKALKGQPYPGPTLVKTSDGSLHKISDSTKLIPLNAPDDYLGVDDVLHLTQVSEATLLHTLRTRYKRDDIYTSAGPILISINPYKPVVIDGASIYSEDQMLYYRGQTDEFADKSPHLFQIADRAYTALMDSAHSSGEAAHIDDEDAVLMLESHVPPGSVRNQSIIISGESGAGKTEATKIIMKFLARITRKSERSSAATATPNNNALMSPNGKMLAALEDRVLSSNPLLETFGNAQTLRNDNSSRFGKFIHIYFNTSSGSITGASISNYLLEKTRITSQVEGERNYHIFYQLLSGADEETLGDLGLDGGISDFSYLGNRSSVKSERDAKDFRETVHCLESIGLTDRERKSVFGIAAAVLHLGNVQFEEQEDEAGVSFKGEPARIAAASLPSLRKACELLGLDEEKLTEAILTKTLLVNGKTIKKSQNVAMAEDKRDALAKMTFSCLFLWLVNCINETLDQTSNGSNASERRSNSDQGDIGFIGVLDIYGFECFDVNGFEQLLINYCNEKLQRHFNRHLFEVEQQIYLNEGVDWSYITFNDNRPCLELIEGGGGTVGILNTLDDAWGGMGTAPEKDGKFATHLHKLFGSSADAVGHKNFITPKIAMDRQFGIVHYAGEVRYTAAGFVEKNMDTLSNELRELGEAASVDLSKKVYSCGTANQSQRSSIRGVSVGSQFRTSLQSLVADLERTQPHYIRCIKPNLHKAPNAFVSGEVLKQLRYSGMMEAIRIRREGYGLREEHESFFHRFSVLLNADEISGDESGIAQLVKILSKRLHVSDADWQIGHSKIFLRRELADKLERLAKLRVHMAARTLGRFGRQVIGKRVSALLVAWMRFRLHMIKRNRRIRASTKLAATYRRYRQVQAYNIVVRGVVRIQSGLRRKQAIHRAKKLRDPYFDLSFRDCQKLLKTEQSRLERAVSSKDFRTAAELEAIIVSVQEATERKRPLTRSVLEKRIAGVQREIDDAVQRKAFSECGALQDKMEELTVKRAELPTIDELRKGVHTIEAEVALAVKNRDFAGAAAGQASLEQARARLADVLAAEGGDEGSESESANQNFSFESRAQLEQEISEISNQISEAIQSKNFGKASSLQHLLDEREKLRPHYPSVKELEGELNAAKAKLDKAVSRKDFVAAGKLNEAIADIEKKLESERKNAPQSEATNAPQVVSFVAIDGDKKVFESRGELEEAIADMTKVVSKAVSSKDFKRADALQSDVDKISKLRKYFPSVADLEEQLRDCKRELNVSIANKQFAKADELNVAIEALEGNLAKEKSAARLTVKARGNDGASVHSSPVLPTAARSVVSTRSAVSTPVRAVMGPPREVGSDTSRTVRKLRPAKPLITTSSESVASVASMLARKRSNACIIVDPGSGRVAGIITDTDFTRRCVAKNLDAQSTSISTIMTANPVCVSMTDPALDALTTMVDNHFRHLPVVGSDGTVAGLLDISKCLTDAISKLENHDEQSIVTAEDVVKQVVGAGGAQAAALQELLGNLMSQALGGKAIPTLRSLLQGKPSTIVGPSTSIRDASILMAENRRAALVVDDGHLVGIFGFKDMMSRAVAKDLDLDSTPVSEVMTPEPDSVLPDVTAIDALHEMANNKYLTLPVCEENGEVTGLVDVLDVIYGCGGAEGWRSVFSSAMDIDDDVSDVTSVHSATSARDKTKHVSTQPDANALSAVKESVEERPVSKLRPSKPIVASSEDSILRTVKLLCTKRGSASLIIDPAGGLAGILTDKDVTCRVVAKYVDPQSVSVAEVMSPNPTCVSLNDSATDALNLMVEHRYRHLAVLDDHGAVVGALDITKCLNIIIKKLEKAQNKSSTAEDVVNQVLTQQGASGAQADALQALLGNLMSQALGDKTVPTLRSLLHSKPSTIVRPTTSIRDAGLLMAENRKASLVVDDDGRLVGIFGFKDMMNRAVAKELDLDTTPVADVMTAEPDFVSPDITVLEALHFMADNKFLTLPVCEENGQVTGVVDVLDVIYGCGGPEGWRSILSSAMEIADDDQMSVYSARSASVKSIATPAGSLRKIKNEKTVANLRPSKPHLSLCSDSVLAVAQLLQRKRGDASLIVHPEGSVAGILTDTDFTRRVVAKDLEPGTTTVSEVMTPDPTCVSTSDSALEALTIMVDNHFRHLPVVDDEGAVVGVLDIGKCLNDAISRLERAASKKADGSAAMDAVKQVAALQTPGGANAAAALQVLLGNLMSQSAEGQAAPTLRKLLREKPKTVVGPTATIRETAKLMAESRHAALVVDDDGRLVGIFGFKDMMTRAIARELPLDETEVSEVMTPEPESVSPDINVLEALQTMYDNKFLTLPVCEDDGSVVGLVNVIDLIYGCGGAEGWRSIFTSAMDLDLSERDDETASRSTARKKSPPNTPLAKLFDSNIPVTLEFEEMDNDIHSFTGSTIGENERRTSVRADGGKAVFKVSDPSGNTHRIRSNTIISDLLDAVAEKVSIPRRLLQLQYVDDEGDVVTMTSDDDVAEAWALAIKTGNKVAKLSAIAGAAKSIDPTMIAVGGAAIAILGIAAFTLLRPKAS